MLGDDTLVSASRTIRPGPLTQFPSKGQRRRMDISERRGSCRGMFLQFDDFFAMAVRTGRLDMRDTNAQAKVEALAKTLGEGPHLSARRYPRLPGHRSSVTSGQPKAGGPMAEMLNRLPSCGSNSMITLSVMGLMNCPSREPLTINWPAIVVPEF